jgi:hypothetical protein
MDKISQKKFLPLNLSSEGRKYGLYLERRYGLLMTVAP